MSRPNLNFPPEWYFGQKLGLFIASLHLDNDEILWWVVRFEDVVSCEREALDPMREAFILLRKRIGPLIPPMKLEEMDAILNGPEWKEPWTMFSLTSGYSGYHCPLGYDFWRWFRLRGYDSMPDYRREGFISEFRHKGVDIANG